MIIHCEHAWVKKNDQQVSYITKIARLLKSSYKEALKSHRLYDDYSDFLIWLFQLYMTPIQN